MSHRNIPVTSQMAEYQYQSVLGPLPHGPGVIGGNISNSFQHNAHVTLTVPVPLPVNAPIDGHLLSEQYNNSIPFGIPPYSATVHHPAASSVTQALNFYNPYVNPGTFTAPPTYGPYDHMPYHGVAGIPCDEFGRNSFIYGHPCKVKNNEIHGLQSSNASTSSGSAADSSNIMQMEPGVADTGPDQYLHARYLMTPVPSTMDVGSRVNVVDRPGAPALDSVLVPGPMYMVAGSYLGQPFLPAGHVWSQLPAALFLPGGTVSRSSSGPMAVQGYPDMASNSSSIFSPHISRDSTSQALTPPPHMHVVGTPNINFYQVAGQSYRSQANIPPHGPLNLPQEGLYSAVRHQGTVLPTGIRIYRPQHGTLPDATSRSHSVPYLRVMPREEIAELVIPDNYEEIADDRHRDMRMDIEHMSYEELLALGDRIGNVSTGLTVEAIRMHLKTSIHVAHSANTNRGKLVTENHDFDSCIICQSDFEDGEKIGILSCRHEYHASCLEKWLLVKNVCPVCKSSALVIEEKSKV